MRALEEVGKAEVKFDFYFKQISELLSEIISRKEKLEKEILNIIPASFREIQAVLYFVKNEYNGKYVSVTNAPIKKVISQNLYSPEIVLLLREFLSLSKTEQTKNTLFTRDYVLRLKDDSSVFSSLIEDISIHKKYAKEIHIPFYLLSVPKKINIVFCAPELHKYYSLDISFVYDPF